LVWPCTTIIILEFLNCLSGFDRDDDNCNYRNSIYRDNTVNGGTLQPCFVDDASPNNNYDKCYETYAGAPPTDLIDVIEYYPLIWGTTPIAETMVEIGGYIKQVDYGRNGTDPQWYDARHTSIVPSGFSASYRVAANTTDSDTSNDVDPKWDPYYDADAGEYLPCTPIYVINLNDGEPFNDFDSNASRHPPFGSSGLASIWARNPSSSAGGAAEEEVDSVAWSLRGDCRSPTSNSSVELEGDQDVLSYFVFADLSDELEEQDARKMREAAAIGGASITLNDTETAYEFLDQPFFPGDTTGGREPFTSTSSGLDSVVVPSLPPTWDRDGDGIPDNFLLANSQAELSEKISAVLNDISRRTAASSSAAVVTNGSSIGGAIFQALYHPSLVDKTTPSKTVEWSGSLWGLFIDQNANFREDTNNNAQLDTDDLVLVYGLDSTGSVVVSKYDVSDLSTRVATTDIEGIEPIWNAVDYLADVTDPINQRAYSATASGRYIITGDKRLVTKDAFTISEARTREFLASSVAAGTGFDFNDAPWLGIDCSGQTNNECSKEVENLVNYLRGDTSQIGKRNRTVDINSDDVIGKGEMNRLLGDIVASSPKVVGAPSEAYDTLNNDTSYGDFKAQYANRRQVVYAGANDGMIHAFNGGFWDQDNLAYKTGNSFAQDPQVDVNGDPVPSTVAEHPLGAELWAYVPVNTMPHLHWLDDVNYQHAFYVDGDPQAFDVRIFDDTDNTYPGGWGTILVVPMRMGGVPIDIVEGANTYTARSALVILDITDPEVPPKLLGEFTDIDLGFTTSKPALVHNVNVSSPVNDEWSLVFGSGPNILTSASVTSGKKPYVYSLNLKTLVDDPHVSASKNQIGGASDPDGFVGDVISIDWDPINIPDGYATDSIFYGTVDIASGVETGRLMYHTPSALTPQLAYNSGQPITAIPSYAYDSTTTPTPTQSIFFGTGKLLVAQDNLSTTLQSFYGLKVTETLTAGTPIDSSDVINTSEITVSTADSSIACSSACPGAAATFDELEAAMSSLAVSGWRLDLNNRVNSTDPSGRSVGNSIMTSGLVLFTEYVPPVELCDLDGTSYLYALDLNTGTSTPFNPFSEEDGNGNSKNSTKIGNGQVKDISLFITADGDAVVVSQDSTGSPVGQKVNKPTPPIPPSTNPSGRVSWRQIVL